MWNTAINTEKKSMKPADIWTTLRQLSDFQLVLIPKDLHFHCKHNRAKLDYWIGSREY